MSIGFVKIVLRFEIHPYYMFKEDKIKCNSGKSASNQLHPQSQSNSFLGGI